MGMYNAGVMYKIEPREEDWGLNRVGQWQLRFCWRPQTCFLSGQQLWGQKAYHGLRIINGPGTPLYNHYWINKDTFIMWSLTRKN